VNAAGGNVSRATVGDKQSFFDLPKEALGEVFDLNLLGTVLPIQVFGESMVESKEPGWAEGSIVNVSSMTAQRPLTGVVGYSAAKAAVENLTRWLATNLARRYGPGMRVNAVAPGFFLGEQNRAMLVNEDGSLTGRGEKIIEHTPAGRFGEPEELVGAVVWLCSPAATFVNGAVIPIDGGFGAFSGV
jgi:NAD(P)-dependent dehydrogenase (short-subunit alcohol dehydrogenase family)